MDRGLAVGRGDLHRRVLGAGGGPADQQREGHAPPLHLPRHVGHLFQAGRDQSAQADQVGPVLARAVLRIFSQGTITPRSITW